MGVEEDKNRSTAVDHPHDQPPPPPYGTFQGVANYPPPHQSPHQPPVTGFPQPAPPLGSQPQPYAHGSETVPVPGYAVEVRTERERRHRCCGCGLGWVLFIIGFFLGAIPWYIGLIILLCTEIEPRQKPGYIACSIAAAVATVAIVLGATRGANAW